MRILTGISNQPRQRFTTQLDDGSQVTISLRYWVRPRTWTMDVEYNNKKIKGMRISPKPNILRQFQEVLPFGIGIVSEVEALLVDDFSEGRVELYLLEKEELIELAANL